MRPLSISKQITKRDTPSLTLYLSDISRIPMITEQEEVELAIRIRNGDIPALEKLVSANLRFVVSVAKQYQSRGMNLHDLMKPVALNLFPMRFGGYVKVSYRHYPKNQEWSGCL